MGTSWLQQYSRKTPRSTCKINIKLFLSTPPLATVTDNINDTVCYAKIVRLVQKLSQENQFNLIEYLAAQIYVILFIKILSNLN
ncbi:dihydroneopterin aldolase [Rickettsia sp. Tenjiku01]|uniref:dihydroneopterin aldolase n=1 Tax=Rickettsia sp. Tenjiku01 TaxID=1736693 RepID=UPI000AD08C01|nr:dihydroneopterin aldolase [Rickettsia sp. Tenjiku01]